MIIVARMLVGMQSGWFKNGMHTGTYYTKNTARINCSVAD
jgi:hypothetical protein